MSFFQKLLSESGDVSCMRLMSLLSLLVGAALALYCLHKGTDIAGATPVISVFVGAAFGGKVWQKYAETAAK